jgi:hypothetical protein
MKPQHSRSRAVLTLKRSSQRTGADVTPLTARFRERQDPSARWTGLEGFLAALPRLFPARVDGGPAIATGRAHSTFDNDAA